MKIKKEIIQKNLNNFTREMKNHGIHFLMVAKYGEDGFINAHLDKKSTENLYQILFASYREYKTSEKGKV